MDNNDWFFEECIKSDQEALLLSAISSGEIAIEDRDCIDRTPLMVAIEHGKLGLVQSLLSFGANPNANLTMVRLASPVPLKPRASK